MRFVHRICCVALAARALAAPIDPPVVNIDYQSHLKLWRAQKNILTAFDYVDRAELETASGLGPHAAKARELLVQAAKELKMASAQATNHR